MASQNAADVKAYLKRAAELESIIYSYEQARYLLQDTLSRIGPEVYNVTEYKYGDLVPYEYGALGRVNNVYVSKGFFGDKYRSDYENEGKAYTRYHSLADWRMGYGAPKCPWGETDKDYIAQKNIYIEKLNERNAKLQRERDIIAYCETSSKEIAPAEAKAREELKAHYENGVLHPKYQGFVSATQIYEYFDTGRCDALEGPNGAYNLYEAELRSNTIIAQLSRVISNLEEIKRTQYLLVGAIERANNLLGQISQDIRRVENAINVNTTAINEFNAATIFTLNRI